MRIRRIELDGSAGNLTIERTAGSSNIRVDSVVRDPGPGTQAWKSWELSARVSDEDLFKLAVQVQHRTDGCRGTNSMIHDYYRELQRFQD